MSLERDLEIQEILKKKREDLTEAEIARIQELLSQDGFMAAGAAIEGNKEVAKDYKAICKKAAAEGMVLLKNSGVLPVSKETTVSVFGRCQNDYFYVGYGSGGDVKVPYTVSLMEGIRQNNAFSLNEELAEIYATWSAKNVPDDGTWGNWPTHYPEMPITEELVKTASDKSEVAMVVIGRSAGEDRESLLEEGSYYLTAMEQSILDYVTNHFAQVVVILDCGNTIDLSWMEAYGDKIGALLYAWQGGMESGNALADVLSGEVNPSGKLTSTIARKYEDYPSSAHFGVKEFNNYVEDIFVGYRYFETFAKDAVLYPFGFGLSYTTFAFKEAEFAASDDCLEIRVQVENVGETAGSEVVQVYLAAPQGKLGKASRVLVAFQKTSCLAPSTSEILSFEIPYCALASYDDSGVTGNKSAFVLEPGSYQFYLGSDVRSAEKCGEFTLEEVEVCEQLEEAAAVEPKNQFDRLVAKEGADGQVVAAYEPVPIRTVSLKDRILSNLPKEITPTADSCNSYQLDDVINGRIDLETFVSALNPVELEALSRGDFIMNSPLGPTGNAGAFGGTIESLRDKGVIPIVTTDGPSGIRLMHYAALLPCGTALASTWNMPLLVELATKQGEELNALGSHVLLAPGMNIMRDPLCGRNFEYFSEDPLLTGKSAAAMTKGIQAKGASACPKHYACNNQETARNTNDSRVSERALREIYLKGFEICVKEAVPHNLMTSYNKINGVWGHYHYELCTTILRGQWNYQGNIVTDWWMQSSEDPDFPDLTNNAYRVRAQVDVLMPGGIHFFAKSGDNTLLESYEKEDGITLGEMQRTAMNVLKFVMYVKTK